MMGFLRGILIFFAMIFVFTLAFGEEGSAYDADLPLSLSRLEESVSQVENAMNRMAQSEKEGQHVYPFSENTSPFGKNGELPSEQSQNLSVKKVMPTSTYAEPKKGLGYIPQQKNQKENAQNIKPIKGKSVSVENLPKTSLNVFNAQKNTHIENNSVSKIDTVNDTLPDWFPSINEQNLDDVAVDVSLNLKQVQEKGSNSQEIKFKTDKKRSIKEIASYGLLTDKTGGFDAGVWDGVSHAKAMHFLKKLSTTSLKSPSYIKLVKRLLLTQAKPPKGVAEENWLISRVKALHHFGEVDTANMLLLGAGVHLLNLEKEEGFAKVWSENMLMTGKFEQTCKLAQHYALKDNRNVFWGDMLNLCLYMQENIEGLRLRLDLISNNQKASNSAFYKVLTYALREDKEKDDAFILPVAPDEILLPMLSTLVTRVPEILKPNVILLLPDTLLRQVAMQTAYPLSVRVQAAEQLVNRYQHSEDISLLSLLYDKIKFDEEVVASPLVGRYAEEEVDGAQARALLWQAASRSGLASTRAMNLVSLWQRAVQDNLPSLGGLLTPNLRNIPVDENVMWFAPRVVRQALYANRMDVVEKWWKPFEKASSLARDVLAERHELVVMRAVETGVLHPQSMTVWWHSLGLESAKDREHVEKVLSLLESSDIRVPSEFWKQLQLTVDDSYVLHEKGPGGLWLRVLGTALEENHVAEVLMIIGQPLRHASMKDFSAQTQRNIITALRFLGLDLDANAMAFEALIDLDDHEPGSF